jgi:DegV family protein with EDD domain
MTGVALCTDSSALLSRAEAERLGVLVVPVAVALDGVPVTGGEDGVDGFYERLLAGARAITSQPSPGEFLDAYERAAAAGASEALSLHLHGALSGTASSARLAAREAPLPVTVVETATVSFGVAVCVRAAADSLAGGASVAEAARAARALSRELRNVFVARQAPAGRVGETAGWALLEVRAGTTRVLGACGDEAAAVAAMASRIARSRTAVRAAVGHAAALTAGPAQALAAALAELPQVTAVERYRVGPAVGAHTGPLAFGAFWWPAA